MKRIGREKRPYKRKIEVVKESDYQGLGVDVRMSLIEALIPIGLMKVEEELQERDLSSYDFTAIWLDGKRFSENGLIAAIGLTIDGVKIVLGLVESATENSSVVGSFLQRLIERRLRIDQGLLVIVDGSKGLIKAVKKVFEDFVLIQRCQWHRRENVVSYMSKLDQPWLRKRLQHAYERPTYDEASRGLQKILVELSDKNQSAAASLEEGLEEILTLHRLGLFTLLGKSLKTTNCMESILSQVERRCSKVGRWHNSSQRQRWMASALLDIEPDLNRIKGWRHLFKFFIFKATIFGK